MKITNIKLNNFRAYYHDYDIPLDEGKNLMIYGENGSGKSSLYAALETFFLSADNPIELEKLEHIFIEEEEKESAFVELTLTNGNNPPIPVKLGFPDKRIKEGAALQVEMSDANEARGFLDYRILLRTHLNHKGTVNLFGLLMEEILINFTNRFTNKKFKTEWFDDIVYKSHELRQGVHVRNDIEKSLRGYNKGVSGLISVIEADTNIFLQKFVKDVVIKLDFKDIEYHGRRDLRNKRIDLKVTFNDKPLDEHQSFLNEARLSALAISLYLAAIKSNPSVNILRVLFLDDIFIGLDMSNRLPMLGILRDYFDDYQIFMTTYDRYWYELTKRWFKNHNIGNWKFFEMYTDDTTHIFNVPHIIPAKDYTLKAKDYLNKKDYPACAMNLRKACEEQLKRLFPTYLKLEVKEDNNTANLSKKAKTLNDLINNLKDYCHEVNIDYLPFRPLGSLKDSMLNPMSHHDIESPIYKSDLIEIMAILDKLEAIDIKVNVKRILKRSDRIKFILVKTTGENREVFITVADNCKFLINRMDDVASIYLIRKCDCNITSINDNGTVSTSIIPFKSLQDAYLNQRLDFGMDNEISDIENVITFTNRDGVEKTLQDLITEIHNP